MYIYSYSFNILKFIRKIRGFMNTITYHIVNLFISNGCSN